MATALADGSIEAQARLRRLITGAVVKVWDDLGSWRDEDVDRFLSKVVPLVTAGQRASVALTDAYLARAIGGRTVGVDAAAIIANARNGTPTADVYRRPFVDVWVALSEGRTLDEAVSAGRARASSTVAMDIQLAMRDTLMAAAGG